MALGPGARIPKRLGSIANGVRDGSFRESWHGKGNSSEVQESWNASAVESWHAPAQGKNGNKGAPHALVRSWHAVEKWQAEDEGGWYAEDVESQGVKRQFDEERTPTRVPKRLRTSSNEEWHENESGDGSFRPGDWDCEGCGHLNFARRTQCQKCGIDRSDSSGSVKGKGKGGSFQGKFLQGDWECDGCGHHNFARRFQCQNCGIDRSESGGSKGEGKGGSFQGTVREGDWECEGCGHNNFARRMQCQNCGIDRSESDAFRVKRDAHRAKGKGSLATAPFQDASSFQGVFRDGDWECEGCGVHNFAFRSECLNCGMKAPEGAGDIPWQDGDWKCEACDHHNWARRTHCQMCGSEGPFIAQRLPGLRVKDGDWVCIACGKHNFASRTECGRCGGEAPQKEERIVVPKLDWVCAECGFSNRQANLVCGGLGPMGCKVQRPQDAEIKKREKREKKQMPTDFKEKRPAPPSAGPMSCQYLQFYCEGDEDIDVHKVYELIEKRRKAQRSKDYSASDELRQKLREMNVYVNDALKLWAIGREPVDLEQKREKVLKEKVPAPASAGPLSRDYCRHDDGAKDIDVDKVYEIIEKRRFAQKHHDFITADKLREELERMDVHINDKHKVFAVGMEPDKNSFPPKTEEDEQRKLLPPLQGKREGEGGAVHCPLCGQKIWRETCECLQPLEESIKSVLATQVRNHLASWAGETSFWTAYCEENRFVPLFNRQRERAAEPPPKEPEKHSATFLMGFLRSRQVSPQTGAPDHLTLSVALMGATKAEQVLDFCTLFESGLVPVNLILAFNLLCKYLNPNPDQKPSAYEQYPTIQLLAATSTVKAGEFQKEQLTDVIRYCSRLGVKGQQYLPLAQAVLPFIKKSGVEHVARLATAFWSMFGYDAAPFCEQFKQQATYELVTLGGYNHPTSRNGWRMQLTLVLALLRVHVEAGELFTGMVNLLIPVLHEMAKPSPALWDQLIGLVAVCAELGLKHDLLLSIIAERCVQNLEVFNPQQLSDMAWSFWSLAVHQEGLMSGIGQATTKHLKGFSTAQLEKIEVAYGASGFVIPEEWYDHKMRLAAAVLPALM